MFGYLKGWLMLLAVLLSSFSAFASTSRIAIPVDPNGPQQMLINAHRPLKEVKKLEKKNGQRVRPSEYRHLADAVYYLPAHVVAHKTHRAPKRSLVAVIRSLRIKNRNLQKVIDAFPKDYEILKAKAAESEKTQKDFAQAQINLLAEKLANAYRVSWYWLLVAALVPGLIFGFFGYRLGKNNEPTIIHIDQVELATAREQTKRAEQRAQRAEKDASDLRADWRDFQLIKAQYEKLSAEATTRTMS